MMYLLKCIQGSSVNCVILLIITNMQFKLNLIEKSFENLLFRNHLTKLKQNWLERHLDGPLSKLCLVTSPSIKDGHHNQRLNLRRTQ